MRVLALAGERIRWRCSLGAVVLGLGAFWMATPVLAAEPATRMLPDFTDLVEQVGPAVVNIRTEEKVHVDPRSAQIDPGMEELFRRFGIPLPRAVPRGDDNGESDDDEPTRRGVGSGFILSADGLIMTNAHVVSGADELTVTLPDKREFKAKLVGADKRSDVALVKIEATNLPTVKIGDVGQLKVGQWVIAIGSPFNFENTVTAGIVSAKQRDTGELLPFIQTDVAINPGNSGGPLINMRGEVVGINSQIYSPSGGYAGISFSIPIDEAMRVADQLRTSGRVVRGRIGVMIAEVTREVAESIGLGKPQGAMVRAVEPASPAEKAGLEAGDIIVKLDGKALEKASDLQRGVSAIKPGTKVNLQVFRRGAYKDMAVTVGEFEADKPAGKDAEAPVPARNALGLTVDDLSDAQKRDLRLKNGVQVVKAEGPAAKSGLREGDVILTVENTEIRDAKQFGVVVAKLDKKQRVTLLVRRGEWVNYVIVQPGGH
ncbi:DegQ family serine endoprotease [Ideonella oryzae]|uniref:Probable periplasmic serine endoprotease DegP-like n=1 Tax=Ideonella oryzae TaxID=2937441 RepID=A0ABT1BHW2_9BURK|nr:DegQ family serine endoprotease [Ideonella oryzae]MCO5975812.1 DegQ family serine endoprotease [Ideonella oryzae]